MTSHVLRRSVHLGEEALFDPVRTNDWLYGLTNLSNQCYLLLHTYNLLARYIA